MRHCSNYLNHWKVHFQSCILSFGASFDLMKRKHM